MDNENRVRGTRPANIKEYKTLEEITEQGFENLCNAINSLDDNITLLTEAIKESQKKGVY